MRKRLFALLLMWLLWFFNSLPVENNQYEKAQSGSGQSLVSADSGISRLYFDWLSVKFDQSHAKSLVGEQDFSDRI